MKKIYTLLALLTLSAAANAQNASAVVFSELGEKFTLFLNGEKQNEQPQANVKIKDLTGEFYQARIDFEDGSLPDFANNNFAVQKGSEVTYVVKKNKKGEYVLRFASQSEMTASSTPAPAGTNKPVDSEVKRISEVDKTESTGGNITMNTSVTGIQTGADVEVTETTTTTTTTKPTPTTTGEKVNMGINVGGINMGVNIDIKDDTMIEDTEVEKKSSTTVTKTTTTTRTTPAAPSAKPKEDVVIVTGTGGCLNAMSQTDYNAAKNNISSKGFDETKLSTAKTIVKANCMSAAQIKGICQQFGFDESRLAFAKYAYDYCTDKNNYYVVNEAFSFSDSTEELNEFIQSK